MDTVLRLAKKITPQSLFAALQPAYHFLLACFGALFYRFPSRKIKVVAITGTKGKSTTVELVNGILEAAGHKTAVLGTIRFKIGEHSRPNLYKMTMPGRFFVQKFLRQAVATGCQYAVLEITSEAVKQFRHKFIDLDALIFLNISPEHIESHGSFENYLAAKLELARSLERSVKRPRSITANADDNNGAKFLEAKVEIHAPFRLSDGGNADTSANGVKFTWRGETINSKLIGAFNLSNMLAAATFAETQGIAPSNVKSGLEKITGVSGRVQFIKVGQNFDAVVDYAHTPGSLEALYKAFPQRKICVLGNTGGGRDKWKRPEMGRIAEQYCDRIILTNEDPYDEDPRVILDEMAAGIKNKKPEIILDRQEAIATALKNAASGDVVLITGKGTDPYIMGPDGSKIPWSDAKVTEEELRKLLSFS